MKTSFLICLLVLAIARSLHAEPKFYQPTDWALGTELPAQPQDVSEHKTPVPGGEIVESRAGVQNNEEIFVVLRACFPIPLPLERLDAAYEGGKAAMQQGNPRTILNEEKIKISGYEGRRYVLETKDGLRVTDHRTVIIGNESFTFIYERPTKQVSSTAADAFFSKIARKKV
jgi:hypothetical protein